MRDLVAELAVRARASASRPVVLIDGRSGSGKTTLGDALAPLIDGAQLVGLDDVYPGWNGLATASRVVADTILQPVDPGYRRWNWETSEPADWRSLDADRPLVIEGAGSLTPATALVATLRIWVELDEATRRARVSRRADAESYAPWWTTWAEQEELHLAADDPRSLADITVDHGELFTK